MVFDQSQFADRGFERARAHVVLDARRLAQQLRDLAAVFAGEVGPDARAEVGRLPDEQHGAPAVPEEVDARDPRHPGRERELGGRRVDADLREGDEVVEPEDAPRRRVFEQGVEQLGRRGGVGVRAVHRFGVGPEVLRERVEAQVGDVVADEAAGHPDRVDPTVRQRRVAVRRRVRRRGSRSRTGCCARR